MKITVKTDIKKPIELVWKTYITPKHIDAWNHATNDWETVGAISDFKVGGFFKYPMRAKDHSFGFDFAGQFLQIEPLKYIKYRILDDRIVEVKFKQLKDKVEVEVIFDAETENSAELQQQGWQQILNAFKIHVLTL